MTKSAAKVSKEDSRRPPSKPPRRARVSRASHAWQVRATKDKVKIGSFAALRGFSYTTRANKVHEKAEQIRARIVCTPAERGLTHMRSMCVGVAETGLGGRGSNMCADESKDFRQPSPAGSEAARGE